MMKYDKQGELYAEIENMDYDPRELEKIEERINDIRKIKKRYGDKINYKESIMH